MYEEIPEALLKYVSYIIQWIMLTWEIYDFKEKLEEGELIYRLHHGVLEVMRASIAGQVIPSSMIIYVINYRSLLVQLVAR